MSSDATAQAFIEQDNDENDNVFQNEYENLKDVRNLLKQFEQGDSEMQGKKPEVAAKPSVLSRFNQNATANPSTSSVTSSQGSSSNVNQGVKLFSIGDKNVQLKPVSKFGDKSPSGGNQVEKRPVVTVPKVFQNGNVATSNDSNNNDNDSKKTNGEASGGKPPVGNKALLPRFPAMKPVSTTSKPDSSWTTKTSIVPKNTTTKSDSISSTTSSSSSASSSSISSSSPSTTSSSSSTPNSKETKTSTTSGAPPPVENGKFDFVKQLRAVDPKSKVPLKRVLSDASDSSSSPADASTPKSPVSSSSPSTTSPPPSTEESPRIPPSNQTSSPTDNIQMRPKLDSPSKIIVERKSDGRKFRKISFSPVSAAALVKPPLPDNVDLSALREEYQKAKKLHSLNNQSPATPPATPPATMTQEEEDDLYFEGVSTVSAFRAPPTPAKPVPQVDRSSARVSMIPELPPEEEGLPLYDDTPIDDEIYTEAESVDVAAAAKADKDKAASKEPKSPKETEKEQKKRLKEEAKARDREEKERKKLKDREEKEKKKKEEEELKMKKTFKITGQEKETEGFIKADAKASGLNLEVKQGQKVTIVRTDQNPKLKWLVRIGDKYGYVDSLNIQVDPDTIRQTMKSQSEEEFDMPTYDDVPEDMNASNAISEADNPDAIYEEFH